MTGHEWYVERLLCAERKPVILLALALFLFSFSLGLGVAGKPADICVELVVLKRDLGMVGAVGVYNNIQI